MSAPLVLQVSTLPQQGWVGSLSSLSSHTQLQSFPLWFARSPAFLGKEEVGAMEGPSLRTTAPCRTHATETCWLCLQASQKPHEGARSSFETFVFQQPPMGLTDLTLPQNQLPTHKQEASSACPDFSQHTPQPHSYGERPMSRAAGLSTPSQRSTQ